MRSEYKGSFERFRADHALLSGLAEETRNRSAADVPAEVVRQRLESRLEVRFRLLVYAH